MVPLRRRLANPRNRIVLLGLLAVVIFLGLATRRAPDIFPQFLVDHGGDACWTMAVYLSLAFLFPAWPPWRIGVGAIAISFAVEVSQLLNIEMLNSIRSTPVGKLVLGQGFLWIDLVRYLIAVAIAIGIDRVWSLVSAKRAGAQVEKPG